MFLHFINKISKVYVKIRCFNVFSFPPSQSHALPSRGILKSNALELVKNQRRVNEQNARVVSVNLLYNREGDIPPNRRMISD